MSVKSDLRTMRWLQFRRSRLGGAKRALADVSAALAQVPFNDIDVDELLAARLAADLRVLRPLIAKVEEQLGHELNQVRGRILALEPKEKET